MRPNYHHPHPRTNHGARQPRAYQSAPRIRRLCKNPRGHILPVAMQHIGDTRTDCGTLSSVYACPICDYRVGMVFDFKTGHPRTLWSGRKS